jgi:uncharacterized YigZ family protein
MLILAQSPSPETKIKISGSRFIAMLYTLVDAAQAKGILKDLWDKHPSATHICWAYRLGAKGEPYQMSDDGEPSGTAGLPILNTLKSKQLTNTLAIVIRYYGGTKLGVSGLIQAYKTATESAIESAELKPFVEMKSYKMQCNIRHINELKNRLQKSNITFSISFHGDIAVVELTCSIEAFSGSISPLLSNPNFVLLN